MTVTEFDFVPVIFRDYPITTRVIINGVEASTGADGANGVPTILDGLTLVWGRTTNVDQPDPGTCSFTMHEELRGELVPMLDVIDVDQTVELWADIDNGDSTITSILVWAGTVTAVSGQAVGYTAFEISVTASDAAASLAEETIGDNPWPVQDAQTRVNRILELAVTDTAPITIDPTIADTQLTYRDVDAQPVLGLLQDVATSCGGVLWVATSADAGTFLRIEDPSQRASLRQFLIDAVTGLVTISNNTVPRSLLAAADILRDSVTWSKDKTQVINSVDVTWQEQTGVDPSTGLQTTAEQTLTVTDGTPKIIRKLSIDTELITEFDASSLASQLLTLVSGSKGWMASGVSIDTTVLERDLSDLDYGQRLDVIKGLLDGTERAGRALTLIGAPGWTPGGNNVNAYIEGGTYTISAGRWQLDLNVSAPSGLGISATFADFNDTSVKVSDFDPTILIRDAWGVAGPNSPAATVGFGTGMFGIQAFGV